MEEKGYQVIPVTVVNTHSHGDHTSGNGQFQRFVMSTQDMADIRPACPAGTAPLADGGEDRAYWYEGVAIFH